MGIQYVNLGNNRKSAVPKTAHLNHRGFQLQVPAFYPSVGTMI